jgi:uncharacterized protein YkwD
MGPGATANGPPGPLPRPGTAATLQAMKVAVAAAALVVAVAVATPVRANTVPDWFWSWAQWKTSQQGVRPAGAPDHIPPWAWRLLAKHRSVHAPAGLSAAERSLADAVNAARATAGLRPLTIDERVESGARAHAQNLIANAVFTHDFVRNGVAYPLSTWLGWYYPRPCAGEDLAGAPTPAAAVQLWLTSPPHRANLLSTMYTTMGVASANGLADVVFAGC